MCENLEQSREGFLLEIRTIGSYPGSWLKQIIIMIMAFGVLLIIGVSRREQFISTVGHDS